LLVAKPFIDRPNWAREVGPDGRPIVLDDIGTPEKCLPDNHGGTDFQPPTFDPNLKLFFVTAHETCAVWEPKKPEEPIALGVRVPSGGRVLVDGFNQFSALRAIDPTTGQRRWEHRFRPYPSTVSHDLAGGLMSTASGLLFTGDNDGYFHAFE
jgi:alcohol dehydrogenase (cytochrome c)